LKVMCISDSTLISNSMNVGKEQHMYALLKMELIIEWKLGVCSRCSPFSSNKTSYI